MKWGLNGMKKVYLSGQLYIFPFKLIKKKKKTQALLFFKMISVLQLHDNSIKWFSVLKLLLKLTNFNLSLWHSVVNPTYNGVLKRSPSQEVISKETYLYSYLFGQVWSGSDFLASHKYIYVYVCVLPIPTENRKKYPISNE